ncbi:MAG: type IV pilus assembly protein PilM, partial [Gaiellaceae bacterium]
YRQAADPPAVNGGLPESVDEAPPVATAGQQAGALADVTAQPNGAVQEPETVDLDPRAAYLALYPEEETRERRRFGRRSAGGDQKPETEQLSRRERREQDRAAKTRAKEAEQASKEAAKLAAIQATEAEKLAAIQAKEAEKLAAIQAKEAEQAAREAEKLAAARAKQAEKAAVAEAREAAQETKDAEKRAAARAKQAEKEVKQKAKDDERAAKEAAKLAAAQAKEAERAVKEAEKLTAGQAKKAEKAATARARDAETAPTAEQKDVGKAEKTRRSDRPKRERKPKADRSSHGKGGKKLVGLKIGASQIAAARVVNNGAPELVEVVRDPLEPGVVVSGEIRDPLALADALRRFFDQHKLPKKGVRLGLSNNRIGVRVFEIEGIEDEQQLDNAIRFRAEEVLPIPLDEAVLDYVILDEELREDGVQLKRILLVVAYRDVVDRYLLACQTAGLEVVGIDLEAFALLRSLSAPTDTPPGGGALVGVSVGHDRTTIAVSNGRHCVFTRVLDWGGWSLNVAIGRELDQAPSAVEAIKRQLSFADAAPLAGLTPEQDAKVREAARGALGAFARELVGSLQFYQAQPGALGIGEIVLTGGTAHMGGLPEQLGRLMGVPIRIGDPFRRIKVGRDVEPGEQSGSLAIAIGLGIED